VNQRPGRTWGTPDELLEEWADVSALARRPVTSARAQRGPSLARLGASAMAVVLVAVVAGAVLVMRPLGVGGPTVTPAPTFGEPRPAAWRVDPEARIGPESTSIPVLVTEIECASGQSPEGRILDPLVEYRADAVVISISIYTDPGDCPSNPEYPLTVALSEPLGDRVLLGGRVEPPTSATPTAPTSTAGPTPSASPTATAIPQVAAAVRPIVGAPISGRADHSAIWTGTEMIVWGGRAGSEEEPAADGAAYYPASDSWRLISEGPLEPRFAHTAVWTGTEMIVWGGGFNWVGDGRPRADGAAYDPSSDSWRLISAAPIDGRFFHSAVWTGTEMLIWSGSEGDSQGDWPNDPGDGTAYDPASDTWRTVPAAPFEGLTGHSAIWSGDAMIIWGGGPAGPIRLAGGAAYDPSGESWEPLADAPIEERGGHSAIWTGDEMLVWGGSNTDQPEFLADGAYYQPRTDTWRPVRGLEVPARYAHAAVWSGTEMLVWGGLASFDDPPLADGFAYAPAIDDTVPSPTVPSGAAPIGEWREPATYSFTVASFCGEQALIGRFRVEVEDGAVVSVEGLDERSRSVHLTPAAAPTLGEMLDRVAHARRENASEVSLFRDPIDGHPVSIEIDWRADAIDDEECYEISSYRPAED
jgi:hypothetical protein